MTWVVDTCVILDVLEGDPEFGLASARLVDKQAGEGLVVCPVSYVELAPAFLGDKERQNKFLIELGIDYDQAWDWRDTQQAHKAWNHYVNRRRQERITKRPVADILIGAFASGRKGLLTRNASDFRAVFPKLTIATP